MGKLLFACLLICVPLAAQEVPTATALPGDPFVIKKTWIIGGTGPWDYLTIDPQAQLLYIAHGAVVQVVDIDSGSVVAQISGFREAHAIALDDTGGYAYVSDGQANAVEVVDRQKFVIESTIPIDCSPRSIAFEPSSQLVFAICGANTAIAPAPVSPNRDRIGAGNSSVHPSDQQTQSEPAGISHVVAIDAATKSVVADLAVTGDFRFAQSDDDGHVYVSVGQAHQTWLDNGRRVQDDIPQSIARLDAPAFAANVHQQLDAQSNRTSSAQEPAHIDWSRNAHPGPDLHFFPLSSNCANPQGLAVDGKRLRLFLACDNQKLLVLNAETGDAVVSLTTGPGDDVLAYDQERGLLFAANGAGYGSLTIVRADQNTDSYDVIQNLPTQERARTLALDPSTGNVYLVTDYYGVDLTKTGGIGTLRRTPISGSFQVLMVGH
jgi:DNA-binding beta-propeller fold protein YncE